MHVELEDGKKVTLQKKLTVKEREKLNAILSGKVNINSTESQRYLQRPHIAITFEALLEKNNLSDEKLVKRLGEIINRQETASISNNGSKSTNIASIDANAKDTIRMLWQVQGRFVEKSEVGKPGDFTQFKDEDLDKIINNGVAFIQNKGKNVLNAHSNVSP